MLVRSPFVRPYVRGDMLDLSQPLLWTVDGVLLPEECAQLVARIESAGCTRAPITTARGFVHRPEVRNNERVIFDDATLAADLFARVRHTLPTVLAGMHPVGANERLRCYRYGHGQRFAPHYDGAFVRDEREESLLTFMVYLNDGFRGGATHFPDLERTVVPRAGSALLFQHRQLHEGCVVDEGVKYVVRSDVMFRLI